MGPTKSRNIWVMRSWKQCAKHVGFRKFGYFKWWVKSDKNWIRSDEWWFFKNQTTPYYSLAEELLRIKYSTNQLKYSIFTKHSQRLQTHSKSFLSLSLSLSLLNISKHKKRHSQNTNTSIKHYLELHQV